MYLYTLYALWKLQYKEIHIFICYIIFISLILHFLSSDLMFSLGGSFQNVKFKFYCILQHSWLRHYATSRKVVGSSRDEVDFFQFT
jgi:hypothetical protein